MKNSRNRLTPFLIISLIILIWILIAVILFKLSNNVSVNKIVKLKLDDDLVQELYSYTNDDDIVLYSKGSYDVNNLPVNYIFSKATRFMTIEDVEISGSKFIVTEEAMDYAIKTAFGPDFKYDLKNIDGIVNTNFELNDNKLEFTVKYDSNNKVYTGTYKEFKSVNNVLVYTKLIDATKDKTVNLKIGYAFYRESNGKIEVCNNSVCGIVKDTVNSKENIKLENEITVSLKKASDEAYYYYSNK